MNPIDCLCFNLRKSVRAVSRVYDEALAPLGLKNTQFSLLAALVGKGAQPVSALAAFMVMDRTTLTRNLQPLLREELVRLDPGEDRRQRVVSLTPAGRRRFAKALPVWEQVQAGVLQELGTPRSDRLLRDLRSASTTLTEA